MEKKKKWWKPLLVVFLVLLVLLLTLVLTVCLYLHSKFVQIYDDGTGAVLNTNLQLSYEEVVDADEEQAAAMEENVAGLEEKEVIEATGEVAQDDKVYNILLIGTDERSDGYSENARGDTCMLLSINTAGEKPVISLVSFERGMGVPILEGEYAGQYDWLTHTFRYGGAELLTREVRECFKVDVDYYVRVNFTAFEAGIDAIGGVDVYLDEAEVRYFIDGYKYTDAVVGMNHLNGRLALNYARLREIDSDWTRIQRQREVVISALNQAKTMSLTDFNDLIDVLLPLVRTNLPELRIVEMILLLPGLRNAEIQQMTIPAEGTFGGMTGMGGRSLFAVDFETNARILHEFLYGTDAEE